MRERPSFIRRAGLVLGTGVLTATLAGCGEATQKPVISTPRPGIETIKPSPAESIIMAQAASLGFKPSTKEQQLWSHSYLLNPETSLNLSKKAAEDKAERRIQDTLGLMQQSENDDFQHPSTNILARFNKGDLIIEIARDPKARIATKGIVGDDGSLAVGMVVSIELVLDKSSGLDLANGFVYANEMTNWIIAYNATLPTTLSNKERQQAIDSFEQVYLALNPDVYAQEATAFIKEVGLLGRDYSAAGTYTMQTALAFIENGMDPKSPKWNNDLRSIFTPQDQPMI